MQESEICSMTATELAARVHGRTLSASKAMEPHLDQIERTNPLVNATVTLRPEKAIEEARAANERLARGLPVGPLHGLRQLTRTWSQRGVSTPPSTLRLRGHVPEEYAL